MATISEYQISSGATLYRVRYYTPDRGETQKRGFKTKRDAEAFAATIEVSKLKGEYVRPALGRSSVAELAPDWLTRKQSKAPSHYRMLESAWRVHVQPRWGHVRVADVDTLGIEDWIAAMLDKGRGATRVLRAHGVLSGILADAVKAKRIAVNPAKGVENVPRKTARRRVYLSADDVHRLADEAGEHRCATSWCWRTAGCVGVRRSGCGSAMSSSFGADSLCRRTPSSSESTTRSAEPRTGRIGAVPVPEFVLAELSRARQNRSNDDLVFTGPDGGYLPRPKSQRRWFAGAVKRAGVQTITPHDLRHTCASLAVSAGVNVLALQRMLGHKSAKVTLDTYADLFDTSSIGRQHGTVRQRRRGGFDDVVAAGARRVFAGIRL